MNPYDTWSEPTRQIIEWQGIKDWLRLGAPGAGSLFIEQISYEVMAFLAGLVNTDLYKQNHYGIAFLMA